MYLSSLSISFPDLLVIPTDSLLPRYSSLFFSPFLSIHRSRLVNVLVTSLSVWYGLASGLVQGWKIGGSRSGRAHLHDMNIMERDGSLANPDYESATC